jgi:hypothetical protein
VLTSTEGVSMYTEDGMWWLWISLALTMATPIHQLLTHVSKK